MTRQDGIKQKLINLAKTLFPSFPISQSKITDFVLATTQTTDQAISVPGTAIASHGLTYTPSITLVALSPIISIPPYLSDINDITLTIHFPGYSLLTPGVVRVIAH
jgi:hypothetical protein